MVSKSSPLKEKRVGVIGFNARPIACSAKKAGASVFVSDYWGDEDISSCCDDWLAILTPTPGARQRQPQDVPLHESLVENLLHLTRGHELDYVLVGSGFDDHSDVLEPLYRDGLLIGCSPDQIRRARDFGYLAKKVESLEIHTPKRLVVETPNEAIDSEEFAFPYLVRPAHSGGGSGIRLARHPHDVINAFGETQDGEYQPRVIQEYVPGIDISSSVLASGKQALTLSVQGQLIGMPTAGRNCDFAYCGNYYPSGLAKEIVYRISEISEVISSKLELYGSVGIDYVVDESNQIWLMEVNPRIQGTLELIETASPLLVTSLHVLAFQGNLPEKIPEINPGVKLIVYSRCDGTVPDLAKFPNIVDRTPKGVMVNMRDPICTVIEVGKSMMDCYRKASETALAIQNAVGQKRKLTL